MSLSTNPAGILIPSIPLLISLYANMYRDYDEKQAFPRNPPNFSLPLLETYDFVIVGGGTAGCVVARRLAEAKFTVLVLETGGDPPPLQYVPIATTGVGISGFHPDINYLYKSIPQENLGLSSGGIVPTEAGKMLGGCSSHNGMRYLRGSPFTYDAWAAACGDKSWRYSNLQQYFQKYENYVGSFSNAANNLHGQGGPVTITDTYFPQREVWIEAAKELNFTVRDVNGPYRVGEAFFPTNSFIKHGFRVEMYSAYIKPKEEELKDYLKIYRYSVVSKITFNENVAEMVEYKRHGIPRVVRARKEIILCAGAYMSPVILIKSGIGPKTELEAAKVKPVMILPQVGKNLQDHIRVPLRFNVTDPAAVFNPYKNLTYDDFDQLFKDGTGYAAVPSSLGQAYFTSSLAKIENPNWPDIQLDYRATSLDFDTIGCIPGLVRPHSRGILKVNGSSSSLEDNDVPILDYRYLTAKEDIQILLEGIDHCFEIMEQSKAFRRLGTYYPNVSIPECSSTLFRSRDYWICYIKHRGASIWHTSGTCRMGKKNDVKDSVVDSELRVHGIKNLRVIDASIMPQVINANTAASVIVIAEKTSASMIRQHCR